MKKTTVQYISAIPGLGKTHWAVHHMVERLRRSEISLYIAPTVRLVDQVYDDLGKLLSKEEFKLVHRFHHETTTQVSTRVVSTLSSNKLKPGTVV